jgi:hypothetical protein
MKDSCYVNSGADLGERFGKDCGHRPLSESMSATAEQQNLRMYDGRDWLTPLKDNQSPDGLKLVS